MTDIRLHLPECPFEYEVPFIPGTRTVLLITIKVADIDWQEKMLPWTLASLINNTDLITQGVHIYIMCEDGTRDRIQTALEKFDLPEETIIKQPMRLLLLYDDIHAFNVNYWAFRDGKNQHKLLIGEVFKYSTGQTVWIQPPPSEPFALAAPCICNMKHATVENFLSAIKHLIVSQFAMEI